MRIRDAFLYHFGPGALANIPPGLWFRVLRENHFAIDPPYWGRALSITISSFQNFGLVCWEKWWFDTKVRAAKVEPPLFILGAWRSGTTHLHNLLSRDHRFGYPNNYEVFFPLTFLTTEKRFARFVGRLFPEKRPQDNMTTKIDDPQEDEFALCALTGRNLPMGWAFPRRREHYDRFLTFRAASERELTDWKAAQAFFIQKLAYRHRKPLVLKSPGHTSRIKILLDLFPDARFVHIHRNPFDVFQSTDHMIRNAGAWWALQAHDFTDLEDRIINQYNELHDVFFEERALIPKGRFHELRYESLQADPIGSLRDLYEALALPAFNVVEADVRRYLASISNYKKNTFSALSPDTRERIAREWRRSFEELGYAR